VAIDLANDVEVRMSDIDNNGSISSLLPLRLLELLPVANKWYTGDFAELITHVESMSLDQLQELAESRNGLEIELSNWLGIGIDLGDAVVQSDIYQQLTYLQMASDYASTRLMHGI
jgi:hypothetical protein